MHRLVRVRLLWALGVGIIFGAAFGNAGVGMVLGAAFGLVFPGVLEPKL